MKEMYRTRSTFGINPSVRHDRVQALIDSELPKMDWHIEQKHPEILVLSIPKYIVGYAMFHFSPPPPITAWFHLFYRITERSFFAQLGYPDNLFTEKGSLKKSAIEAEIRAVTDKWKSHFPKLKPDLTVLEFNSVTAFAKTYLSMIRNAGL